MKICEAGRSTSCCRNPDIRSINTMGADTAGNFEIRAGNSVSITTETNGIRIAYTGGITTYDNTDGNIVIDNDLFTINLADDLAVTGNVSMGGDLGVTGDAVIAGDLTVNGTYYTVHAEHVYTQDDYIILREGATTPLAAGSYAGFQVTKYDGTNDGRLVVDNAGVARVGDVGDEQPLLTRDEAANLNDGALLKWDATNSKAVDEGTVGSDTKPIKIVNGVATAVTDDLQKKITVVTNATVPSNNGTFTYNRYGRVIFLQISALSCAPGQDQYVMTGLPIPAGQYVNFTLTTSQGLAPILGYIDNTGTFKINSQVSGTSDHYGSITYMINE